MRALILALVLVLFTNAHALQNGGAGNTRNAATWYQRAIEQYLALPESQRELLVNGYDPATGPPSPELRMALANMQGVFQNIQRGSTQETADFGLDYEQGFELLLPHLSPLRQITRAAKADAMVRLQDGDTSGAAERLSSLYRMAGHGGDDRILISSLVGQAIFSAADEAVQHGADGGAFNAADAAKLLGAAKALGQDDPFQYLECVASEQEIAVNWLSDKFEAAENPQGFAQGLFELGGSDEQAQALGSLDAEGFQVALDQYDAVMTRVVAAFANPDPEAARAALNELEAEMERGEHGVLASVLVPAFGRLLDQKARGEKMINDRIAMLEELVSGEVKPEEAANAALWYLRGLERLATLEPAQLTAIRTTADSTAPVITDELAATLDSAAVRDMTDLFEEASRKRRCDFKAATKREQTAFVPAYASGMNDALKALRLDAIRQAHRQSDDGRAQATARLGLILRVLGHFGNDPMIASALVGHSNFIATSQLIQTMHADEAIHSSDLAALGPPLERISRRDPFGYVESVVQTRKAYQDSLRYRATRDDDHQAQVARSSEIIEGLNGDQLLMVAFTFEVLARAGKSDDSQNSVALIPQGMADVMSAEAASAIRASVAHIAPSLAVDDWSVFSEMPLIVVATPSVIDRMRRARADVRDLAGLLRSGDSVKDEMAE